MTEIICITATGKARASTEAVARMLREELVAKKKRVLITRFADPIKQVCRNWFCWDGQMDDTGRSWLQYVGSDVVRAQRPDFWVDFTVGLLSMLGSEWDYVIIPDCRWPNELDMERYGFQSRLLRIEGRRGSPGPLDKIKPDFTITSHDTPELLRGDVAAVADRLLASWREPFG